MPGKIYFGVVMLFFVSSEFLMVLFECCGGEQKKTCRIIKEAFKTVFLVKLKISPGEQNDSPLLF